VHALANLQLLCRANSNLVLEADREVRRRADEATGEVETLHGKLNTIRMGDRIDRAKVSIEHVNNSHTTHSVTSLLSPCVITVSQLHCLILYI
jgi:hypothetical protein